MAHRLFAALRLSLGAIALTAVSVILLAAPEFSEPAALAAKSLLLDISRAGNNLVAVGNRGHVVVSTDEGITWSQSVTPTRAMLTGVSFANATHGWAVGHDGVIIATTDGGRTWTRQDDSQDMETVFLDVHFRDANHGFAVGAYGRFVETADGGRLWTARKVADSDFHFNRLTGGPGGLLYLVGEAGTVLVSRDAGRTWDVSEMPYEGSLFAAVPLDEHNVVVAGLRGHILTSSDQGGSWTDHSSETKVLISSGIRLENGAIIFAGQGGNFFLSSDSGETFNHWQPADFATSIAEIIATSDGAIVTVGEAGAVKLTLPVIP
ncbi:MAG: YCF48-related protein [Candidatus Didemnitutus sp.]|nr:YCF48-related protein [Candidatus Didemnitutus sp.]